MGENSKIEWTDTTWNPVTGCTPISEGCAHCYAKRMAKRLAGRCGYPAAPHEFDVTLHPEKLYEPLHWKKPRRVFVCSMSDLFHEDVQDQLLVNIFAIMALCPQHTFQVLTKRAAAMSICLSAHDFWQEVEATALVIALRSYYGQLEANFDEERRIKWPLHNVWLGVTAENQEQADKRIPMLLETPAAVRFVSIEPMLGPVNMKEYWFSKTSAGGLLDNGSYKIPSRRAGLDWVIVGGETGRGARQMLQLWVRDVRDQCQAAGVPFFFKKWGDNPHLSAFTLNPINAQMPAKHCGGILDGREWNEYPVQSQK